MSDSSALPKSCPKCGAELPSEATEGLCPRCLMAEAMQPTGPKTPAGPWQPPSAEELQKLLPQYEITMLLGRGGMGAVYKGRQISLDRPVAIKILSNDLETADASFAERFKNEARAMARLAHPGIVAVHDFGETPDHLLYIVMEFIEGTDVSRMIAKQKRLHTEHAMAITAHVCDALAYAHERGIIHRDIKPANIMVSYDGVVKVADFGLAKMSKAGETLGLTQSGMAMGTLHYMAPEALMLGAGVDHRADIYAVGVMLYQMLTGKLPQGMFELPSLQVAGLDPRYDGIIAKALRDDRELRYQGAIEMRYDLDHILTQPVVKVEPEATQAPAALPTEARPQRTAAQPYRPPQVYVPPPKPKSAMGGTLAWLTLIAVLMGGGYYWMKSQQAKPAGTDQPQSEKTAAVQTAPEPEPATGTQPAQTTATTTKAVVTDQDGWRSLFDGKTLAGWKDSVGKWRVEDGLLVCDGTSYLQTKESFGDFELEFDWRVGANADSGVKYRIDAPGGRNVLEFQITSPPRTGSGSLQDLYPESRDASNPVGQWNTGRILAVGTRCEHWVNGEKMGSYDLAGDDFRDKLSRLGFGADHAFYGLARPGPILLQGLKGQVAFRNLRLRVPSSAAPASTTKTTAPTPPPAPLTGLDLQLAQLEQSFQAAVERDAGSAFKAAVTKLNAGYNRALDAAIATATKSALLDDVVRLKEEQAAMTKLPTSAFPPPDDAQTPAALKTLRTTYRNAIAQYTGDYAKALVPLYEKYDQTLTTLQAEQTRASKTPEALRIKTMVEIMRQWRGNVLAKAVTQPGSVDMQSLASGPVISVRPGKTFTNSIGMKFVSVPGSKVHMCIHETRKQDYAAYAAENSGVDSSWKNVVISGKPVSTGDDHPVTAVSWEDATAFCAWLSRKEGRTYRLPNEFEWNLAVVNDVPDRTNLTPEALYKIVRGQSPWGMGAPPENAGKYRETGKQFPTTAPVMSFKPNTLGIYDLGGNVWEWCHDWFSAEQRERVARGAAYENFGGVLNSGWREPAQPASRDTVNDRAPYIGFPRPIGFRCVVEDDSTPSTSATSAAASQVPLTPPPAFVPRVPAATEPVIATNVQPFTNTLGMKFVPVPGTNVLFCIHETRRQDYAAFAGQMPAVDGRWKNTTEEGIPVSDKDDHPVVSVNWDDVQAFCEWLSKKEGKVYRLPTDQEWSFAVGIGNDEIRNAATTPEMLHGKVAVFPWGTGLPPPKGAGNYADITLNQTTGNHRFIQGYTDGFATTAPVMSFTPNKLGLYDLGGNVWEWVSDWWNVAQKERVLRGVSFVPLGGPVYSSARWASAPNLRRSMFGFRLVAELPGADSTSVVPEKQQLLSPSASQTASATKDKTFVNTLGMKFMPVPIIGGPTNGQRVLFSTWETRVQDYEAFTKKANHPWRRDLDGFESGPTQPAVHVPWADAVEFCKWLTKSEQQSGKLAIGDVYRLPTDHEWSCAVGIGTTEDAALWPSQKDRRLNDVFPWGNAWPPPAQAGNLAGEELLPEFAAGKYGYVGKALSGYRDGFPVTAPVGSFLPDQNGLHDLCGNVSEWVDSWWDGDQKEKTFRGSSWLSSDRVHLGSSFRRHFSSPASFNNIGFRCVLVSARTSATSTAPAPAVALSIPAAAPAVVAATKDKPFVNTLGMQFVPVPGTKVLFCIHETRVGDFAAFVADSGYLYEEGEMPFTLASDGWKQRNGSSWKMPGFPQTDTHPVGCMSWEDAVAFATWLSKKEHRAYRLPTDYEWSAAVGISDREDEAASPEEKGEKLAGIYPWGGDYPPRNIVGNYAGEEAKDAMWPSAFPVISGYQDGFSRTSPVQSFAPNNLGIYDLGGNVVEWCQDWLSRRQDRKVLRGTSGHDSAPYYLRSSWRGGDAPRHRNGFNGFRLVVEERSFTGSDAQPTTVPTIEVEAATKDKPFTNTLGMKFVPVPNTKVLFCMHETRKKDYAAYAAEVPGVERTWTRDITLGERGDGHPVGALDWRLAEAFCAWLSKRDGIKHRLPTDREWSFAVGIGNRETWSKDTTLESLNLKVRNEYPWGAQWPMPSGAGNYGDLSYQVKYPSQHGIEGYDDGFATAAPVMSFQPNRLGIYDLGGNVKEMCAGWSDPHQDVHVLLGSAWDNGVGRLESSWREADTLGNGTFDKGFRVVVELPAP
ncbi:MAG: SUMF1/EgtB/PvdO family nonheme iron enzyme [Prosthecobacter sp.]|uniref:SUMF1/EgtB/PvdO family nonheme iron enzyme n=1 Tax=Prosthecobacter sp. TaxID=1965333 RepID=UPI0039045FEC